MNKRVSISILSILFLLHTISNFAYVSSANSLVGKITDSRNGEALIGVSVYFPDLKIGAVSDVNGEYQIKNLPASKVMIQLTYLGFRTVLEAVDLSVVSSRNFQLEYAATELNEVVVTGLTRSSEQKRTPTPISIVSNLQLKQNASTNIIDAIAFQPGVSQVTTGVGISKPVIRGLGYNRVVVVNDGVRQEGQQWGDEHGVEIDEFQVGRVEILKGPASLVYGSDAMAGVVNLISLPTLPEGKLAGNFVTNYQSKNGLFGYSMHLEGNQKGLVWDVRLSNKQAHSYQNRFDGYVFNSGFRENAVNGLVGINKSWGFSHLTFSSYYIQPGITEGERDSVSGKFIKHAVLSNGKDGTILATDDDFKSYHPSTPFQQINHYKTVWNSNVYLGKGNLNSTFAFQQNRRQEFADVLHPNDYQLYFLLNTWSYDLRYNLSESNLFNFSFGVNGMKQTSENKGVEFLVPEYHLFDVGVFAIAKKNFGKFDLSGGLRLDNRSQSSNDLFLSRYGIPVDVSSISIVQRFKAFNVSFSGISGSLGATWQLSKSVYTKLNLSRGFRAPNIAELGANGAHEGTLRYEIGNPDLKPENSLQLDYTIGINAEHISAELNLFDNQIDNYIYLRKLSKNIGGDSIMGNYSAFKYFSGNAHLYGGEFRFDIHPHPFDWLHIENSFSFVHATQLNQPDSTKYLPFTPPAKWLCTVKCELNKCGNVLTNSYVKIEFENYFAQNQIYSAYATETKTSGYTLLNAGFGTDFMRKHKNIFSLYFSANNLTDEAYQSHLSRLKYASINNSTGRNGVFNMGRNFSMKLIVPLELK
ncbi:MAG: TonB-dependent receptor [Bacteroidales bacterium]